MHGRQTVQCIFLAVSLIRFFSRLIARSDDGDQPIQLICCSTTLEFYEVLHGVEDKYVWKHPRQTFAHRLSQIEWALQNCYRGRFALNPS